MGSEHTVRERGPSRLGRVMVAAVGLIALLGGCSSPATPCSQDRDCAKGMQCLQGNCLPLCQQDADCPAQHFCTSEGCAFGCREDRNCKDVAICKYESPDDELGQCDWGCRVEDDRCPAGKYCGLSGCQDGCRDTEDCPSGQYCEDHTCKVGCTSEEDCDQGFVCDSSLRRCVAECDDLRGCSSDLLCIEGRCVPIRYPVPLAHLGYRRLAWYKPEGTRKELDLDPALLLPPGRHAYKLLDEQGQETFDPDNPYRTFQHQECSELWVRDCRHPRLLLEGVPEHDGPQGAYTVTLRWEPGQKESPPRELLLRLIRPDGLTVSQRPWTEGDWQGEVSLGRLVQGLEGATSSVTRLETCPQPGAPGFCLRLRLSGLPEGKYRLEAEALDQAGRSSAVGRLTPWSLESGYDLEAGPTAPLRLPFWVEPAPFDWSRAATLLLVPGLTRKEDDELVYCYPPPGGSAQACLGGSLEDIRQVVEQGYLERRGIRVLMLTGLAPQPENSSEHDVDATETAPWIRGDLLGLWPTHPAPEVRSSLGGNAALRELVRTAHDRKVRVVLWVQLNHVHSSHLYCAEGWCRPADDPICGSDDCRYSPEPDECMEFCRLREFLRDLDWKQPEAARRLLADGASWLETYDLDGLVLDEVKHLEELAVRNLSAWIREDLGRGAGNATPLLLGETAIHWPSWGCGTSLQVPTESYEALGTRVGPQLLDGQLDQVLHEAVFAKCPSFWPWQPHAGHLVSWTEMSTRRLDAGARWLRFASSQDQGLFSDRLVGTGTLEELRKHQQLALTWLLTLPGLPLLLGGDELGARTPAEGDPQLTGHLAWLTGLRATLPALSSPHLKVFSSTYNNKAMAYLREPDLGGLPTREGAVLVALNLSSEEVSLELCADDVAGSPRPVAERCLVEYLGQDSLCEVKNPQTEHPLAPLRLPPRSSLLLQPCP